MIDLLLSPNLDTSLKHVLDGLTCFTSSKGSQLRKASERIVTLQRLYVCHQATIDHLPVWVYTGLGRGPYGGRHLGSCPPSGPQFQARGWTSTTFAHCKLTYFIFIIAYDCFRNPSSTKQYIFLYFCLHNVLLIFS